MGEKNGETSNWTRYVIPVHQIDQDYCVGQIKVEACDVIPETESQL